MKTIIMLSILASSALSGPTVYKIDEKKNTAESVIVPVSSTGALFKFFLDKIIDELKLPLLEFKYSFFKFFEKEHNGRV